MTWRHKCTLIWQQIWQGKKISIIGAWAVALRRVKTLIRSGAEIQVISPRFEEGFEELDLETSRILIIKNI